ncbi:MAG TPA: hypothetical protein VGD98_05265 [Ktedonobacteraceae bacterium]
MSKARQNIPTLAMWERILCIRQRMESGEKHNSMYVCENALSVDAVGLRHMQMELMSKVITDEIWDTTINEWVINEWVKEDAFDDFDQWDKSGWNTQ